MAPYSPAHALAQKKLSAALTATAMLAGTPVLAAALASDPSRDMIEKMMHQYKETCGLHY